MNQYENRTIAWLMENIDEGNIVVPAIQRSFVWSESKICSLFDSLTLGYPIGTLLFWAVKGEDIENNVLNQFVVVLDENRNLQRGERITDQKREYKAVLDGQQRMTALRIGICGSLRLRKKKYAKTFVEKRLCLNVLHDPKGTDDEMGFRYEFAFIDPSEAEQFELADDKTPNLQGSFWVPVRVAADKDFRVIGYEREVEKKYKNAFPVDQRELHDLPSVQRDLIYDSLEQLYNALTKDANINYFVAENFTRQEVVDIFDRVNTGGTPLSASDLMLSLASGNYVEDAQIAIEEAAEVIQSASSCGLQITKEHILRTGLLFADRDSVSLRKSENYSKNCISLIFQTYWDDIKMKLDLPRFR